MSLRAKPAQRVERGNPCLPAGRSLPIRRSILTGLLRRFAPRNDKIIMN